MEKPLSSVKMEISPEEIIIPGINQEAGIELYDDDMDIYLSVLRSFVPNAYKVIEKLRTVSQETLKEYAVNVHGLKSISANIGAEELKKAALHLETNAKSGNLDEVLARNKILLEEAEKVASGVQAWLSEFDSKNPKQRLASPDPLLLDRLRKSCEAYDMDGIDEVMDNLESASYDKDGELITWIREKITELDFSSIAARLAVYREESN